MPSDGPAVILTGEHPPESDEPLSHRIVRLVAVAADREPTDLEPLGRAIDTDALDALFSTSRGAGDERSVEVAFHYVDYRVEVAADGTIRLLDDSAQRD